MDADEVIDRLYARPPAKFTAARDEAAKELRKAGERAEAARVAEQQKPTAAAAAVNQLVRKRRKDVERFLQAAAALRDAQVGGGKGVQNATKREREALTRLVRAGGTQVRQSLQAAAVDHGAAEQLLGARLVRELEPAGFGTLIQHAKPSAARESRAEKPVKAAPKPRPKPNDGPARARLAAAKRGYLEAQTEERRAERNLTRAREKRAAAQAAVDKAQAALDRIGA